MSTRWTGRCTVLDEPERERVPDGFRSGTFNTGVVVVGGAIVGEACEVVGAVDTIGAADAAGIAFGGGSLVFVRGEVVGACSTAGLEGGALLEAGTGAVVEATDEVESEVVAVELGATGRLLEIAGSVRALCTVPTVGSKVGDEGAGVGGGGVRPFVDCEGEDMTT